MKYAAWLRRFSSAVLGHFLYILVLLPEEQEGIERRTCSNYKIAGLDFHQDKWVEFDVNTRAFSRIRLVEVQERLMLVGFQEGCYSIMQGSLSLTGPSTLLKFRKCREGLV